MRVNLVVWFCGYFRDVEQLGSGMFFRVIRVKDVFITLLDQRVGVYFRISEGRVGIYIIYICFGITQFFLAIKVQVAF